MKTWLDSIRIPTKLFFIGMAFIVPLAVMLLLMVDNANQTMAFAEQEIIGNEFQRPLVELLDALGSHQLVAQRFAAGDATLASQLALAQTQVDRALEALDAADAKHGATLQFTEEGLAKRQREAARPEAERLSVV